MNGSGVTLGSYTGGLSLQPFQAQFNRNTGLLYGLGSALDPLKLTVAGSFNIPVLGDVACTADAALNRYFCVAASPGGGDVIEYQLFIYNLTNYSLLSTVSFGTSPESESLAELSGGPTQLVRWGNAGLAVITKAVYSGDKPGLFLIDGPAINANAAPDVSSEHRPRCTPRCSPCPRNMQALRAARSRST